MIWYGRWVSSYKDGDSIQIHINDKWEEGKISRECEYMPVIILLNKDGEFEPVDTKNIFMVMPNEETYIKNRDAYYVNAVEGQKNQKLFDKKRSLKHANTIL